MRLWHYELIPYLPKAMVISQWQECIAIKRQWEKGTLKHRLVSYVIGYDKRYFGNYVSMILTEMTFRKIKHQKKYYKEFNDFCGERIYDYGGYTGDVFRQHNDRYLKQCLYNLQEKADRGIITQEEWQLIYNNFKEYLD